MNQLPFSTLPLHPDLLHNLVSIGYESMTPIQAESLPHMLAGKDLIAQGKTGSGKTAAFGLGLLSRLDAGRSQVQALVLCPTRELADQVANELRKLARRLANIKVLTLCGGMPLRAQIASLEHGAHIIVGTPGRIEDHLGRGTLKLDCLSVLVLDEADRMLEMGFQSALDVIIAQTPRARQTLLFSATFPAQIQSIAGRIMRDPVQVRVESTHDHSSIRQHFYKVADETERMLALRLLLLEHRPESTVVFCNTRREVGEVTDELVRHGFSALALTGELEQRDRDQTLVRFANKSVSILVATDVAARGLDIDALDAVINYHLAQDSELHVHRIGRSGRAGSQGFACTLYCERDGLRIVQLEDCLARTIVDEALPPRSVLQRPVMQPKMATLQIGAGKKQKIRPGDILGALTGDGGISGVQVGKIYMHDNRAYVAVARAVVAAALAKLDGGKLKGKTCRARLISG
ncbi:ATP-dependent RNA helicase DbpA [Mariprofundus erugo]|uniref:ATP-dependent RNA helicase DbpA n=1 Tax=Mariprofundus erugo TaxID=2528639 RepID=UPI0010FDC0FE|nr:ATP-dependent RNA helicase DbpA [Mariprofundus erugo]TLS77862.1 ATP-dependent RNA helicase DbpA [Mariprofundus erugo]